MSDDASVGAEQGKDANGAGAPLPVVLQVTEAAGANAGSAPERSSRPQASRRKPAREISVFGAVPADCTSWGVKRQTRSGGWDAVSFGDGGVELHQFPLSELTDDVIPARWGAGTYKVQWWRPGEGGGRKFLGQGPPITYKDPSARAVDATAVHAPDPLGQHLEFMRMVGTEAQAKIDSTLALARALTQSAAPAPGLSASDILAIVREERAAAAAALQAQREEHAAQLAALEAKMQAAIAARDDDDEPSALEATAAAAIAAKKKTGGFLGFLAAIAEHKDLIKEALPLVIGTLSTVNEGLKTTQAAAQASAAQRQRPQAQPRTVTVDPEVAETEAQRDQREAWERLPVDQHTQ